MKLVILDDETAGQDLDWSGLITLGTARAYRHTTQEELIARVQDAEAIFTNKVPLDRATLALLPKLQYIGVTATGYDVIDLAAANEQGITVTNVPAYGTEAVAQQVFALILGLTRAAELHSQDVRAGGWTERDNWTYSIQAVVDLEGLTLGVLGYGRIGKAVARVGKAFGMKVLAYGRGPLEDSNIESPASIEELFAQSDIVSLHCPLTPETQQLVNSSLLSHMKPTAYLINTSRGGLIQEHDLARALAQGRLAGAGLDVLSQEPPPADHPLLKAPHCLITPHMAWASRRARQRLVDTVGENFAAYLRGEPQNVVSR